VALSQRTFAIAKYRRSEIFKKLDSRNAIFIGETETVESQLFTFAQLMKCANRGEFCAADRLKMSEDGLH